MSIKSQIVRYVTIFLLASVLVGGIVLALPQYRRGRLLREQAAALDAEIETKKAEIAELKDRQRRFKTDPDFVESIARQNKRVYPGELVFVFGDKK